MNWKDKLYIQNEKQFSKIVRRFITKEESEEANNKHFIVNVKNRKNINLKSKIIYNTHSYFLHHKKCNNFNYQHKLMNNPMDEFENLASHMKWNDEAYHLKKEQFLEIFLNNNKKLINKNEIQISPAIPSNDQVNINLNLQLIDEKNFNFFLKIDKEEKQNHSSEEEEKKVNISYYKDGEYPSDIVNNKNSSGFRKLESNSIDSDNDEERKKNFH